MLPEKFVLTESIRIKLCTKWLSIFRKTCCKYNHFVMLAHSLKKTFNTRSYENVNLTNLSFYFNWKNYIRILDWFELRVDKCFIQIKNQCFSSDFIFPLRSNKPFLISLLTTVFFVLLPLIIYLSHFNHLINTTLILWNLTNYLVECI